MYTVPLQNQCLFSNEKNTEDVIKSSKNFRIQINGLSFLIIHWYIFVFIFCDGKHFSWNYYIKIDLIFSPRKNSTTNNFTI